MTDKIKQKALGYAKNFINNHTGGGSGGGGVSSQFPGGSTANNNNYPAAGSSSGPVFDISMSPTELVVHPSGGTYPRTARLSDGSVLAVSTRRAPENNRVRILQVSRSPPPPPPQQQQHHGGGGGHNAGAAPPLAPFEPWGEIARGEGDVDNGFLLEVPGQGDSADGRMTVLAAFRNHTLAPDPPHRPTHFRITVCGSSDGGRTWRFLSQAHECGGGDCGLWEPFMRVIREGEGHQYERGGGGPPTIQLTYSGELGRDDQETFACESRDGGRSWTPTPPRCLRCHAGHERLRDGMQGIVAVRDLQRQQHHLGSGGKDNKELVMVMETNRDWASGRGFRIEYCVSSDGGRTWGKRGLVYEPHGGRGGRRSAGSPQIAVCGPEGDSKLAVVFMTDEDVDEPNWPAKAAVKVVFSEGLRDGRIAWQPGRVVEGAVGAETGRGGGAADRATVVARPHAAWPGIMALGPDEVLISYAHKGKPVAKRVRFT